MFTKREQRLTSKNLITMQIATSSLQGELFLPGGTRPRKNSLKQELIDMAQGEGKETCEHYKALLAVNIKDHQEKNTSKSLKSLVNTYYSYTEHLSVLRLYYYYCLQQSPGIKDKRTYSQYAMDNSTELLQHIDAILALYDENSDDYQEALEKKTEYTVLDDTIKVELEKLSNKRKHSTKPNDYSHKAKLWKQIEAPDASVDETHPMLTLP